jgi:hypothetical protein
MAIDTAPTLLLLGAGIFSLRSDVGLMSLLISDQAGGASMRCLLPAAIVVPFAADYWRCTPKQWIGSAWKQPCPC